MKMSKIEKCNSCGDRTELILYNNVYSCGNCLSRDKNGNPRYEILDKVLNNQKDGRKRIRQNWTKKLK